MPVPAAPVKPDAAASGGVVPPAPPGAGSRSPDSSAAVGRLPDRTSLAKIKGPTVASPTGVLVSPPGNQWAFSCAFWS
eukprot:6477088-Amphidinium_carterae.1